MKWLRSAVKYLICYYCKQDIDAKNQDNMSSTIGRPMCEDCYNSGL
jgi:hypothetical protein